MAVKTDGRREIIGLGIGPSEAETFWTEFLRGLSAGQSWRHVADQVRARWPKLAALMDDSEADVLAYMSFPSQHRTTYSVTGSMRSPPRPGTAEPRRRS